MRKSIGYGAYGQNPFQPDFTVCKSEGGTANCPSEYVKEFGQVSPSSPWIGIVIIAILIWTAMSLRSYDQALAK